MPRAIITIIAAVAVAGLLVLPAQAGNWGPSQAGQVSVTVYEHANFKGRQATFYGDTAWLPRGISSLRVQGKCTVTLFNNYNFQGERVNVTSDVPNLEGSRVGNDRVLSLAISPFRAHPPRTHPPSTHPPSGGSGGGIGGAVTGSKKAPLVILYEHENYQGRSLRVRGDIRDMQKTSLGNDTVSSIRIQGAEVMVYQHPGYGGDAQLFLGSIPRLTKTRIGNDTISSIRVKWTSKSGGGGTMKHAPKTK